MPLLLARQENNRLCGRVHVFAMGVLYTTAQTMNEIIIIGVMGTQDPTVIPVARGKKRDRNLDPALRTWLGGQVTRKRSRNTKWAPRGLTVDLAPTTVHDKETLSFYSRTISQYESTALHWNVAFDMCCLGGEDGKIFACCWRRDYGRTAWLIPVVSCCEIHTHSLIIATFSCYVPTDIATRENEQTT